ncbi:MAG: membrane protein insertion efficiency factor YidD [Beijerinckiaceae bacterium]
MTRRYDPITALDWRKKPVANLMRMPLRGYGYTISSLIGRTCRHLPTCSEYMDEALGRHGAWAGGWMGFARLCRCRPGPGGTSGFDPVRAQLPDNSAWYRPWHYGRWRSTEPWPASCEAIRPDTDRPPS